MLENFKEIAEKNIAKLNPNAKFTLRNGEELSAMMIHRATGEFRFAKPYVLGGIEYNTIGNVNSGLTSEYDIVNYTEN